MKIISMSVYGSKPMYVQGAVKNALLVPQIYPGWKLRVYCSEEVDTGPLKQAGCEIVCMSKSKEHSGMFWRFLAAWDGDVERIIFRDADSRLNVREAVAVRAWEDSGLVAHCMHDHPHHACFPIFGGMWGIKGNFLPKALFAIMIKMAAIQQKRVADMMFLSEKVHPLIANSLLRHSSVPTQWPSVPFPEHPKYEGFVGQQFDDRGNLIWP